MFCTITLLYSELVLSKVIYTWFILYNLVVNLLSATVFEVNCLSPWLLYGFWRKKCLIKQFVRSSLLAPYTRRQLNLVSRKINKIPRYQISVASSTNQPNSRFLNTSAWLNIASSKWANLCKCDYIIIVVKQLHLLRNFRYDM